MLKVAFREEYIHPLPENHRFPMEKYDLLPKQLLHEGTLQHEHFFQPVEIDIEEVLNVHTASYIDRLYGLQLNEKEQRLTGFIHSHELINREKLIMEGTRKCAELALANKAAMNIAGGTHHAFTNRGEGFCLLNDLAIASKWLQKSGNAQNILIIDLDVHQGNGTAEIFNNDPSVFTFSMHGENNYPLKKENSSCDIPLPDGIKDEAYLYLLESHLNAVLNTFQPNFIFYQCGVDILETDKLGRLGISVDGCKKRDKRIFESVRQLNVPIVCTMGGGYSPDIKHIVEAHANTFRVIQEILY
jgi:acetoin utilization deacetylase AcuC-like enzyme